jgi:hypothetical protein
MGRAQTARQGDFLALMEPGPTLSPALRAMLRPMMAALLLEAMAAGSGTDAGEREAADDQDRA